MMESRIYELWLLNSSIIPFSSKMKLITYFENSFNLYNASRTQLLSSGLLKEAMVEALLEDKNRRNIEKDYENFMRSPYSFMTSESEGYPRQLLDIFDPVYGFFYYGKLPELRNGVAIVGARRCTAYGKKMAKELATGLGQAGITVISGMARGIDSFSHMGCIEGGGKTIAVLGSGLDVIYPAENASLYENIKDNGCVLSEYCMGTQPKPQFFPIRNRIVSALAKTVVVVEARDKSGSLITADLALDQGKDVYVLPGRLTDSLSFGCNRLLSQGAGIIYSIDQFVADIVPAKENKKCQAMQPELMQVLSKEELVVYSCFDFYPKSLSLVEEQCPFDYLQLLQIVMRLEEKGYISEAFKNQYVIC